MNLLRKTIVGGISSLMLVASVNAAYIDFTQAPFTDISGTSKTFSATFEGVGGITLTAAEPEGATLTQTENKGIGIYGGWTDVLDGNTHDIDLFEVLDVTFDDPVAINSLIVSDLFAEKSEESFLWWSWEETKSESGNYAIYFANDEETIKEQINGIVPESIGVSSGIVPVALSAENVKSIQLYVGGFNHMSTFKLAGMDVVAPVITTPEEPAPSQNVPEPATLSLLGLGLLGLSFYRRKK